MKIAVTYDNGEIFQHFGKTESFKVYEVEDNKVVSSEVIGSNGTGHGALAGLLAEQGVNVLICGGIGGGAQTALTEAGIELCAGAQGNTDQAVENYLKGELVSSGANCDHHHHEEVHHVERVHTGNSKIYILQNLGCAHCAAKMEEKINNLPGVTAATITYTTKQLRLSAKDPDNFLPEVQKICASIESEVKVVARDELEKAVEGLLK